MLTEHPDLTSQRRTADRQGGGRKRGRADVAVASR